MSVENLFVEKFVGQKFVGRNFRQSKKLSVKKNLRIEKFSEKIRRLKIWLLENLSVENSSVKNLSVEKFVKKFVYQKLVRLKNLSKHTIGTKTNSDTKEIICGEKNGHEFGFLALFVRKWTTSLKRAGLIYGVPHVFMYLFIFNCQSF